MYKTSETIHPQANPIKPKMIISFMKRSIHNPNILPSSNTIHLNIANSGK